MEVARAGPAKGEALGRLLRQPLLQFVLIGALIFGLYSVLKGAEPSTPTEIHLGPAELKWLHETWRGQFGHPPSAMEMRAAVTAHVDEEMRYREGLALGLDRDDTVVRRRLAQKYDFLLGSQANETIPTEAQLRAVFERTPARYAAPALTSFCQVYFGEGAEGLARSRAAVAALAPSAAGKAQALPAGSGLRPNPRCYEGAAPDEAARDFGTVFAGTLDRLPRDAWRAPVEPGYGFHAVLVRARIPGQPLNFQQARRAVEADWRAEIVRQARERQDRDLRKRYRVTIDEAALSRLGAGTGP